MRVATVRNDKGICGGVSPAALHREVVNHLNESLKLPPDKLEEEIDVAERKAAGLRDCIIEKFRQESITGGKSKWRKPLDDVNVALGLIASVAYPATGIHRSYLEQAEKILSDMEEDLSRLI